MPHDDKSGEELFTTSNTTDKPYPMDELLHKIQERTNELEKIRNNTNDLVDKMFNTNMEALRNEKLADFIMKVTAQILIIIFILLGSLGIILALRQI